MTKIRALYKSSYAKNSKLIPILLGITILIFLYFTLFKSNFGKWLLAYLATFLIAVGLWKLLPQLLPLFSKASLILKHLLYVLFTIPALFIRSLSAYFPLLLLALLFTIGTATLIAKYLENKPPPISPGATMISEVKFQAHELYCHSAIQNSTWGYASSTEIKTALEDCYFDNLDTICNSKTILTLGVASSNGSQEMENMRAFERGRNLARYISNKCPHNPSVGIINAGKNIRETIDTPKQRPLMVFTAESSIIIPKGRNRELSDKLKKALQASSHYKIFESHQTPTFKKL